MPHVTPTHVAAVDRQLCDECGLCMPLCPPMAIHMRREGLLVDAATCTGCRKCIDPCPVGALAMVHNPLLSVFQSSSTASSSGQVMPVTPLGQPLAPPAPGAVA